MFKPIEYVPKVDNTEQSQSVSKVADMEDFGKSMPQEDLGGKRRVGTVLTGKKRKGKKAAPKKYKIPEGVIDPYVDYIGWLEQKKQVWRDMLRRRATGVDGTGIKSFFTSTTRNVSQAVWQILHIAETDAPGIFRIWAIIEGVLESKTFDVPRILYLNSIVPGDSINQPGIQMTRRMCTLPRDRTAHHLYELKMTEKFYRSNASMFSTIFNHSDIEGVYETQVTPLFRALLHVGCFGQLRKQVDLTSCLDLDDLTKCTRPVHLRNYLAPDTFQMIHFYRSKAGSRQMWGLFVHQTATVYVYVVDPGMNKDALPQFKRVYAETLESKEGQEGANSYPSDVEFKVDLVSSEKEAIRGFNKILQDIKDEGNRPIMLGIQVAGGQQHLRSIGLSGIREFPNLPVPYSKVDSQFPALGWQLYATRRMIGQFFNLEGFLKDRIELSRYADVPICNIESDYLLFLSDVFLARRLRKADMVLWCSSSSKPDLGGSEQDDNSFSTEELKYPELNVQGTYDNVCIELEVWDLALNTLIQSFGQQSEMDSIVTASSRASVHLLDSHFNEADANTTAVALNNGNNDSLSHVLVIIRQMVKKWLAEVREDRLIGTNYLHSLVILANLPSLDHIINCLLLRSNDCITHTQPNEALFRKSS
jgi:DNA polymerase epsilon subunit 1